MVRYVHVEEERNVLGLLSCAVLEGLTFLRVQRNSNASAVVLRSDYPSIQNNSALSAEQLCSGTGTGAEKAVLPHVRSWRRMFAVHVCQPRTMLHGNSACR